MNNINQSGKLYIGNIGKYHFKYRFLRQMEERAKGSPFYIFDETCLKNNLQMIRESMPSGVKVCFSMKANPWLVEPLKDVIDYLEVCSPGELNRCRSLRVESRKVVLDGVMKSDEEIRQAVCDGEGGDYISS